MVTRLHFKGGVPQTTLAANLNAGVTSLTLADATGWTVTTPFDIIINKASSTARERIKVGGQTGVTLNTLTRGQDGTVDQDHVIGDTVELAVPGQWYEDMGGLLQVTTAGDVVYYDGTSFQRLAIGTAQQMMKAAATAPSWSWRALPYFTSTGSRDTADAAPADGDAAYIGSASSAEGIYFYNGTSWRPPWNMDWGLVASASSTSTQSGISTLADITFATATWTAVSNRLYEITLTIFPVQVTSTGNQAMEIDTGASGAGTALAATVAPGVAAGANGIGTLVAYQTGSGSISVHARISTSAGTVNITNASVKGWFTVKDVGPTGAPA